MREISLPPCRPSPAPPQPPERQSMRQHTATGYSRKGVVGAQPVAIRGSSHLNGRLGFRDGNLERRLIGRGGRRLLGFLQLGLHLAQHLAERGQERERGGSVEEGREEGVQE